MNKIDIEPVEESIPKIVPSETDALRVASSPHDLNSGKIEDDMQERLRSTPNHDQETAPPNGFNFANNDVEETMEVNAGPRSFKIVVIGDKGSGKTSLIESYVRNNFPEHNVKSVLGVEKLTK